MRIPAMIVGLLLTASAAMSQTKPGDMIVDIPFVFVVGGQTLPAGHYIVKDVNDSYLRIFNSNTTSAFMPAHAASRSGTDESKLVFHCYAGTCFLSSAWIRGRATGRELFRSQAERELAQGKTGMKLAVVRSLR